jgi:hypothetical protein
VNIGEKCDRGCDRGMRHGGRVALPPWVRPPVTDACVARSSAYSHPRRAA